MAKTIVQHDEDPGIAIMIVERDGIWTGTPCTQCGYQCRERYPLEDVQQEAEIHIDRHESVL